MWNINFYRFFKSVFLFLSYNILILRNTVRDQYDKRQNTLEIRNNIFGLKILENTESFSEN